MNPSGSIRVRGNFLVSKVTIVFSRRTLLHGDRTSIIHKEILKNSADLISKTNQKMFVHIPVTLVFYQKLAPNMKETKPINEQRIAPDDKLRSLHIHKVRNLYSEFIYSLYTLYTNKYEGKQKINAILLSYKF
jgi:hypothetical protein